MKTFIWIVSGALLGGAGTAAWLVREQAAASPTGDQLSLVERLADIAPGQPAAGAPEPVAVGERLAIYREAVASDQSALRAALQRAAGAGASPARDLEIDALLVRLAEIEPSLAASEALALGLDDRFVTSVFEIWAATDADAALQALTAIGNARLRRAAALAMTDVVARERVAAMLSAADRNWLTVNALMARAEHDPIGAFEEALAVNDESLKRRALVAAGTAWARQDPAGAVAQAVRLPEALRQQYLQSVSSEWGRLDPSGLLAYVETARNPMDLSSGLQWALVADPQGVLRVAENIPGTLGRSLQSAAMMAVVQNDPLAALPGVEAMPPGQDRSQMLQQVASAYARKDPKAALAWVQSLSPPSRDAQMAVLSGVASSDPALALQFLESDPAGIDRNLLTSLVMSGIGRDPEQAAQLAERLYARDDPASAEMLGNLVSSWARQDADGALEWALSKGDRIDGSVLVGAAQRFASQDPRAAAAYVDRLPVDLRDQWIASVAGPYARYDLDGAIGWIAQYQGQPGYETAFRQVVQQAAQSNPQAAAVMLSQAGPDVMRGTAPTVASVWARQAPQAAAQWASNLGDPRTRAAAMTGVATGWASADAAAAQRWVLTLPRGEDRDGALAVVTQRRAAAGEFDRGVLDAFSSDLARQNAVTASLGSIAQRDADEARALLEEYVTDPTLRERGELMIEQGQQRGQAPTSITLPFF